MLGKRWRPFFFEFLLRGRLAPTPALPQGWRGRILTPTLSRRWERGHDRAARLQRVPHGVPQVAAGGGVGRGLQVGHAALRHQAAAAHAGARADVDQVLGGADGVFVVFDHHQRVAVVAELLQRAQQDAVVARVKADGGFVEHVAHALQVAAQLRGQADALRFAARQGGRAAIEREVAQAHLFQKRQTAVDLGQQVARDFAGAAAQLQAARPLMQVGHRQAGQGGERQAVQRRRGPAVRRQRGRRRHALQQYGTRHCVQSRAGAAGAGLVGQVFHLGFVKGLLAAFLVGSQHRIIQQLALRARQLHTGAHAVGAPAVLAVVGEQARVGLGVAGGAHRAGALGGKHFDLADVDGGQAVFHRMAQAGDVVQHMHHALAVLERARQRFAQLRLVAGADGQAHHRQLDGVFLEAVDARKAGGRQELAIHAQVGKATRARPVGQLGVDALARHHQRRQKADGLAAKAREDLRRDALGRLRLDARAVVDAVLHAQLDVEQAQKVPDLGDGADRALAPAARQALLDRHRGRDAVHGVDRGASGRLHDGACIGVERFQIAALALVEHDVEGQRGLARARHAGDDVELAARNGDAEVLQVVLAGADDVDGG